MTLIMVAMDLRMTRPCHLWFWSWTNFVTVEGSVDVWQHLQVDSGNGIHVRLSIKLVALVSTGKKDRHGVSKVIYGASAITWLARS